MTRSKQVLCMGSILSAVLIAFYASESTDPIRAVVEGVLACSVAVGAYLVIERILAKS